MHSLSSGATILRAHFRPLRCHSTNALRRRYENLQYDFPYLYKTKSIRKSDFKLPFGEEITINLCPDCQPRNCFRARCVPESAYKNNEKRKIKLQNSLVYLFPPSKIAQYTHFKLSLHSTQIFFSFAFAYLSISVVYKEIENENAKKFYG